MRSPLVKRLIGTEVSSEQLFDKADDVIRIDTGGVEARTATTQVALTVLGR
jgi:hypothetical protein